MQKKISTIYSFTLPENEKEHSNNEVILLRKNYLAAKDFHGCLLKSKIPKSPKPNLKIIDNVPFKKNVNRSDSNFSAKLNKNNKPKIKYSHVSPKHIVKKCLSNNYSSTYYNTKARNPNCFSCANLRSPIKTNRNDNYNMLDFQMTYYKKKNKDLLKQNEDLEDLISSHDNSLRDEIYDLKKKYEKLNNEIKIINKNKNNIKKANNIDEKEILIKKNKELEKKNKYYLNIIKLNQKFIKELENNNQEMERMSKMGEELKKETLKTLDLEKKGDTIEEEIEVDEVIELRRSSKTDDNKNINKKKGIYNNINKKKEINKNINKNYNRKWNNALIKEREDIIKKYEDFCKEYGKKNEELNNKITQLSIENNKLSVEKKEKEYQISELETRNENFQKKISELINENNLLEKKYSELLSLKTMESIEKNLSIQDLNENINNLKI